MSKGYSSEAEVPFSEHAVQLEQLDKSRARDLTSGVRLTSRPRHSDKWKRKPQEHVLHANHRIR